MGWNHTIGLKKDGTVIASGSDEYGECEVGDWKNIVLVIAGSEHTIGVTADGEVLATGDNRFGQCDVNGRYIR